MNAWAYAGLTIFAAVALAIPGLSLAAAGRLTRRRGGYRAPANSDYPPGGPDIGPSGPSGASQPWRHTDGPGTIVEPSTGLPGGYDPPSAALAHPSRQKDRRAFTMADPSAPGVALPYFHGVDEALDQDLTRLLQANPGLTIGDARRNLVYAARRLADDEANDVDTWALAWAA
jgi:hypothetical protein